VADGMAHTLALQSLILANNDIKAAGVEALAVALAKNRALLELNLSFNPAGSVNAVR